MYPSIGFSYSRQRGGMLLLAIFVLVVLVPLGGVMFYLASTQQTTTSREVLSTRAWFAAVSGSEWAMTQLFPLKTNENPTPEQVCAADPVVISFSSGSGFDSGSGLLGCSASVSCQTITEGDATQHYIESRGTCSGETTVTRIYETWARDLDE